MNASSANAILSGIPIVYPRMVFMESVLDSKLNPLTAIARSGQALTGFVNKFNGEAELLDDLVNSFKLAVSVMLTFIQNDHWTAKTHKVRTDGYFRVGTD